MSGKAKARAPDTQPVIRHPPHEEGRDDESRPLDIVPAHYAELYLRDGPIPDAQELVRYGYAHPDAPQIILDEFTRQGEHRRLMERRELSLERRAMDAALQSERMGVACALLLALIGFGCATYLVATGHGVAGTVIFGMDVGALVSAFILGRFRGHLPLSKAQKI